jgi:hypothetical protein
MERNADQYIRRLSTLLPRLALRWKLVLPEAHLTGTSPAAAARESPESTRERLPTSERNSAANTTPIPGRLLTTSASGLARGVAPRGGHRLRRYGSFEERRRRVVKDMNVMIQEGNITGYKVNLEVTFVLEGTA